MRSAPVIVAALLVVVLAEPAQATVGCRPEEVYGSSGRRPPAVRVPAMLRELCGAGSPRELEEWAPQPGFPGRAAFKTNRELDGSGLPELEAVVWPPTARHGMYLVRDASGAVRGAFDTEHFSPLLDPSDEGAISRREPLEHVHFDALRKLGSIPLARSSNGCVAPPAPVELARASVYVLAGVGVTVFTVLQAGAASPPPAPLFEVQASRSRGTCGAHSAYVLVPEPSPRWLNYRYRVLERSPPHRVAQDFVTASRPFVYAHELQQPGWLELGGDYLIEAQAIDTAGNASPFVRVPVTLDVTDHGCSVGSRLKAAAPWLLGPFAAWWLVRRLRRGKTGAKRRD